MPWTCHIIVRSRVGSKYTSAKSNLNTDGYPHRHIAFVCVCVCVCAHARDLHQVHFLWITMVQNCNFFHVLKVKVSFCIVQYPIFRIYSSLSIARYLFIQLSELEEFRVKKLAQGFTRQLRIRARVLLVKSPMLYP